MSQLSRYPRMLLDRIPAWHRAMRAPLFFTAMLGLLVALGQGSCTHTSGSGAMQGDSITFDKAAQSAISPDQAIARLKAGNRRFVSGDSAERDYRAQVKATATRQYPFA